MRPSQTNQDPPLQERGSRGPREGRSSCRPCETQICSLRPCKAKLGSTNRYIVKTMPTPSRSWNIPILQIRKARNLSAPGHTEVAELWNLNPGSKATSGTRNQPHQCLEQSDSGCPATRQAPGNVHQLTVHKFAGSVFVGSVFNLRGNLPLDALCSSLP